MQELNKLWDDPKTVVLDTVDQKYAIISDVHLGNKSRADDFVHNEEITMKALSYYQKNGFKLILLGDFEEFWQFDLPDIMHNYNDSIYKVIRSFGDENVIRVYGNHDIDWSVFSDPIRQDQSLARKPVEALKLNDADGKPGILLLHGHQGTVDADKFSWITRGITGIYGKTLEHIIDLDPAPSLTKSMIMKDYEKEHYEWAKSKKCLIICGHTHRAIFASRSWVENLKKDLIVLQTEIQNPATATERKEELIEEIYRLGRKIQYEVQRGREIEPLEVKPLPCYFNTGCALYKTGITVMEIADDEISLQKWDVSSDNAPAEQYGKESLSKIITEVKS